jgi:hypothetical protein
MILPNYIDYVLDTLLKYMGRLHEIEDIDTREMYRSELSESYSYLRRIEKMPFFVVVEYWQSIISKYSSIFVEQE